MKRLTAIIIDDEQDSVELLKLQLKKHCPAISSTVAFTDSLEAYEYLCEYQAPDVVFLDIDMPGMNGFELLEKLYPRRFNIIFITAHNQHALKAFRMNALDYLLKPADPGQLYEAVLRIAGRDFPDAIQLNQVQRMLAGNDAEIFALPTQAGVVFITLKDIVCVEAISNYIKVFLIDGKSVTAAKNLKDLQDLLEQYHFLRVHRSYIINLKMVKKFFQVDNLLLMANDVQIPVARHQRQKLKDYFIWL